MDEAIEDNEKESSESSDEYESEDLEKRLYNYSEVEDENYLTAALEFESSHGYNSGSNYSNDTVRTLSLYYRREEILPDTPNVYNFPPVVCYIPQFFSVPVEPSPPLPENVPHYYPLICPNKLISPFIKNHNTTPISIFFESDDLGNFSDGWYRTQFSWK